MPNIAGIEGTPVRRIQDELQQGIITTVDFGHRLAFRATTGGAHVRDILEADAEELARAPEGGGDNDLVGRMAIYRSESITMWEAMELREQGFRISSGNFALSCLQDQNALFCPFCSCGQVKMCPMGE